MSRLDKIKAGWGQSVEMWAGPKRKWVEAFYIESEEEAQKARELFTKPAQERLDGLGRVVEFRLIECGREIF